MTTDSIPTAAKLLAAVPYRNESMDLDLRENGTALAEVPLKRPRWLIPPFSWILPFSRVRRIELDAVGRSVLEQVDGKRTVESIVDNFAKIHKLSFREAQLPVTQFLQQLAERGIIALVGFEGKG